MTEKTKFECKYGASCYRTNGEHRRKFSHPPSATETGHTDIPVQPPQPSVSESHKPKPPKRQTTLEAAFGAKRTKTTDEDMTAFQLVIAKEADDVEIETDSGQEKLSAADFIRQKFLVSMPRDFFAVWHLAESLNPKCPSEAFNILHNADLVGPFDVLGGKFKCDKAGDLTDDDYLVHWRFSTDLPEIQTVMTCNHGHYGYWRDDPSDDPIVVFVKGMKGDNFPNFPSYAIVGDNLFAALLHIGGGGNHKERDDLVAQIESAAMTGKFDVQATSERVCNRKPKRVAVTLHRVGIVVPLVNDVGYRRLAQKDGPLRKMLELIGSSDDETLRTAKQDELQEVVSYVQFANDEADFGAGLELGHDLFVANYPIMDKAANQLLSVAYTLLKRQPYDRILKALMKDRRRKNLSVLEQ